MGVLLNPYIRSGFNSVDFNGTDAYLSKATALTGVSDSSQGILSMWLRLDANDGSTMYLMDNGVDDTTGGSVIVTRTSGNKFEISLGRPSDQIPPGMIISTVGTYLESASWVHILASWDTNFTAGNRLSHLYVNGVSDKAVTDGTNNPAAFNVDYTQDAWFVGATRLGNQKFNGAVSEFFFAPGQFLDFSDSANRLKFVTAQGRPASLGSDGSTPTGVAPAIYLGNPAATFATNKGTGGNFTVNGSLDTASTSP